MKRVQVSRDGKFIFTGKTTLKILENIKDKYGLLKMGGNVEPFIDLKLLRNGNILVFAQETSDLVKYNENLKQVRRLQGQKKINLSKKIK